ncbi:hypothetical protein D3C75_640560 [compost metagenome]
MNPPMDMDSSTVVLVVELEELLDVLLEELPVLPVVEVVAAFLLKSMDRAPLRDRSPTGNSRTTVVFWCGSSITSPPYTTEPLKVKPSPFFSPVWRADGSLKLPVPRFSTVISAYTFQLLLAYA